MYRDFEINSKLEEEKPHNLIVFGAYANYHHRRRCVYLARCALVPRPGSDPEQYHEEPGRFILVRIFLTMCDNPRIDFWVYDRLSKVYIWWKGHELFRHYMSDPSIRFDFAIVEGGSQSMYVKSLVQRNIWYNPARMVLRGCKVADKAQYDPSLVMFTVAQGDKTDLLWEADLGLADMHAANFLGKVRDIID
jgi:hypothetical protein